MPFISAEGVAISDDSFPLTFIADDGYPIKGTLYSAEQTIGNIVVAGATGVPQQFYRRFAEHARLQGFTTLTFDYRGIGKSKPSIMQNFKADFFDWACLDLAAAIDKMSNTSVPLYMVGHSFGGHAFGLLPNHHQVSRCYLYGTGAGWHGWMPFFESLRVRLLWNAVLPFLTKWKGYAPFSILGMGEDLPLDVYKQWRYWCQFPHYFFDDLQVSSEISRRYDKVTTPIIAANALDDLWALPKSRDAFVQAYKKTSLKCVDIDPSIYPKGIGHIGYFRSKAHPLWDNMLQWFREHLDGTQP